MSGADAREPDEVRPGPWVERLAAEGRPFFDSLLGRDPTAEGTGRPGSREDGAAPGAEAPLVLSRYRIDEVLGKGGMGVVYRAFDLELGRTVALKRISGLRDEERIARLLREARAIARLAHPGVVTVYDVGEVGGEPYFTMQLLEGRTFAQVLAQGRLPPRRAAEVARDVALALAACHEAGIVHRDVKPENLVLGSNDRPVLADFGLAKELHDAAPEITAAGAVVGTLSYLSPEHASRGARAVTAASDQFSLGVVLYEALAGRVPFPGDEVLLVLAAIQSLEPLPLRKIEPRVHRDLDTIVARCLEKDPGRRYPDCRALAGDLGRYLAGEPIVARPPRVLERVLRRVRRRPGLAALAALAATFALYSLYRAAGPGTLLVESDPPGAVVRVDGRERGRTPLRVRVWPPGATLVELAVAGHAGEARVVEVPAAGSAALEVRLSPLTGAVTVTSGDGDLQVEFADPTRNRTHRWAGPFERRELPVGSYEVLARKENHFTRSYAVEIQADREAELHVDLVPREMWMLATSPGVVRGPVRAIEVDGDRWPDLAFVVEYPGNGLGVLSVVSGRSRKSIWDRPVAVHPSRLLFAADLDRDGTLDAGLVSPEDYSAFAGPDGSPLVRRSLPWGEGMPSLAGDLDGDQVPDIVVAEPIPAGVRLHALSGADGLTIGTKEVLFSPVADLDPAGARQAAPLIPGPPGTLLVPVPGLGIASIGAGGETLWAKDLPGLVIARFFEPGTGDGAVLFAVLDGGTVLALDPRAGEPLWSAPTGLAGAIDAALADWDGDGLEDLLVAGGIRQGESAVVVLSAKDGARLAEVSVPGGARVESLLVIDGTPPLPVLVTAGGVQVLDRPGGGRAWSVSLSKSVAGASLLDADADGSPDLVLSTAAGDLRALRSEEPPVIWTHRPLSLPAEAVEVAGSGGESRLAVRQEDGTVDLLDPASGRQKEHLSSADAEVFWRTRTQLAGPAGWPVLAAEDGSPILLADTGSGEFLGLDPETGEERLRLPLSAPLAAPPIPLSGAGGADLVLVFESGEVERVRLRRRDPRPYLWTEDRSALAARCAGWAARTRGRLASLVSRGLWDELLKAAGEATESQPADLSGWLDLQSGFAQGRTGKRDEAVLSLSRALDSGWRSPESLLLLYELGDGADATRAARALLGSQPLAALRHLEELRGRPEPFGAGLRLALADLDREISRDPVWAVLWTRKALVLAMAGRTAEAAVVVERAESLDVGDPSVQAAAVVVHALREDSFHASLAWNRWQRLGVSRDLLWVRDVYVPSGRGRGRVPGIDRYLAARRDPAIGKSVLGEFVSMGYESARLEWSAALRAGGELARASEEIANYRRAYPLDALGPLEAARVRVAEGDLEAAVRALRHTRNLGFRDPFWVEADPTLRPLKGRTDFEELLAGW
ncbi:MAG: protein kinase [Planctomycetes bacterium]|nr:protein kinase [Planctomycetota bacterium]